MITAPLSATVRARWVDRARTARQAFFADARRFDAAFTAFGCASCSLADLYASMTWVGIRPRPDSS
jgi:hypothetical protein